MKAFISYSTKDKKFGWMIIIQECGNAPGLVWIIHCGKNDHRKVSVTPKQVLGAANILAIAFVQTTGWRIC